jgi:hypothetical protein
MPPLTAAEHNPHTFVLVVLVSDRRRVSVYVDRNLARDGWPIDTGLSILLARRRHRRSDNRSKNCIRPKLDQSYSKLKVVREEQLRQGRPALEGLPAKDPCNWLLEPRSGRLLHISRTSPQSGE